MSSDESAPLLPRRDAEADADQSVPRKARLTALVLVFLLSTGANWTEACLGPLKSSLLQEFEISNTQYGVISASTQLVNTILPIFTGLWIDRVGASRMAIFATSTVCIGAVLAALACTSANSYTLLVLGRIIQGIGVIVVDTAATKLIVSWAGQAGWLGMAISCNFAFDRAAGTLSKASAVPIAQLGGTMRIAHTLWAAAAVSTVSLIAALVYSSRLEPTHRKKSSRIHPPSRAVSMSSWAMLQRTLSSLPAFFVYILVTQFYQPIAVFNNLSADILRWKGSSQVNAGYLASLGQATPILVAPLLGGFFDRYGHRMKFVSLTAVLLGSSFGLLAWTDLSPLLAMVIFSIGNALNTPPYLCSLAILLKDEATFGCSYGLWKAMMQGNQIIMNVTMGRLQDKTPGQGYERVLLVLFISKAAELVWGLSYVLLDQIWAQGILSADETKRQAIEASLQAQGGGSTPHHRCEPSGLKPSRNSTRIAVVYLVLVVASAWLLFLGYYSSS
jgi:MFS family permease